MKVAVIGGGTMGNGIAHVFAQNGHEVTLVDAEQTLWTAPGHHREESRAPGEEGDPRPGRCGQGAAAHPTHHRPGAAADVELAIEAVFESFDVKEEIFSRLDELCAPETVLASNTSSISLTRIGAVTRRPEKVIGMHFMNPVPVMKLVEIIRGQATDQNTLDRHLAQILRRLHHAVEGVLVGRLTADDLHQLHHRHRIHEVHADHLFRAARDRADAR